MAKGTVNKVILLGRLGKNPEVKVSQSGMKVANLSLATNDGTKDNITTEWHKVVVFGKSAEVIEKYTSKGSQLYIEGRLQTQKWQDKNGNNQYSTSIVASSFQFIGGGNNQQQNGSQQPHQQQQNQGYNHNQNSYKNGQQQPNMNDMNDFNNFDEDVPF